MRLTDMQEHPSGAETTVAAGHSRRARSERAASGLEASSLLAISDELRDAADIETLLDLSAHVATTDCGFARGVVARVDGPYLAAGEDSSHARQRAESAALSRRLRAEPQLIAPNTIEAKLVRDPHARVDEGRCRLAESLGLEHYILAPVAPEGQTVALLVLDRASRAVTAEEVERARLHAYILGTAMERVVLRSRLHDVSAELNQLMTAARAIMYESLEAPISASAALGGRTLFLTSGAQADVADSLTAKEREVAELLAVGHSNREIGAELHMAPDTVKDHVGRLVRKLGARNRVEAAARYTALQNGTVY